MVRARFTFLLMLALSLFLPGTAAARQPARDAGEFVILSAQYGTERHHVDVTPILREGARRDRVFRATNRVFKVDPDPGVVKVLRIFALAPNGQERMFEYPEGGTVDGALFRSWGHGEWGHATARWSGRWNVDEGEYLILSAQYGTEHRHVDVTERLREGARHDRVFRASNHVFGVDPHPGRVKTLRIYARGPNGREHMFEYSEGSLVDGSKFRGWSRGEWATGKDRWSGHWDGERR